MNFGHFLHCYYWEVNINPKAQCIGEMCYSPVGISAVFLSYLITEQRQSSSYIWFLLTCRFAPTRTKSKKLWTVLILKMSSKIWCPKGVFRIGDPSYKGRSWKHVTIQWTCYNITDDALFLLFFYILRQEKISSWVTNIFYLKLFALQ